MNDQSALSHLGMRGLRYFAVLAEELHFGRAAIRLRIAQPALSMQIRSLESKLGVTLFERGSRSVSLTPAGIELFGHARRLLFDAQEAVDATRKVHGGLTGTLRIGHVASLSAVGLPALVARIRQRFPDLALAFRLLAVQDQRRALIDREVDIAFFRSPAQVEEIREHRIFNDEFTIAVPAGHRLAALNSVPVEALSGERVIMFPEYGGELGFHVTLMRWLAEREVALRVAQVADGFHIGIGLVGAGIGIAFVPRTTTAMRLPGVRFVALSDSPILGIIMATRSAGCPPKVQRVFDMVAELCASEAGRAMFEVPIDQA
jgi:DNA-binding transcriptional LysR family regulator